MKLKGFALLDEKRRKEIASLGGRAVVASGKKFKFTSESAQIAGRLGGAATSQNKQHMSRIGKIGGKNRWLIGTEISGGK